MTPDERKRMVGAIFEVITATEDGIDRLEPCEEWRPYIVAAIPEKWVPTERKTGLEPAMPHRRLAFHEGWLELQAAA